MTELTSKWLRNRKCRSFSRVETSTVEEYAKEEGTNCPVCGSEDIEGKEVDIGPPGIASQEVWCLNCDAGWTDIYKLTGYANLEK